jgi:hypothetical protein
MTGPTEPIWPEPVAAFQKFLTGAGLTCLWHEHDRESGGKLLQYSNAVVAVRFVFDQCVWLLEIADVRARPSDWHDAAILRDLLHGGRVQDVLELTEQIEMVQKNWPAIVRAFAPERSADTHRRLAFLSLERAKRRAAASKGTPD